MTVIKTERLVLRPLADEDGEKIFALRSNENVNKYLDRDPCTSRSEAQAFIDKIKTSMSEGGCYYWGISLNNELIGTICLWNINEEKTQAEVGFELLPEYQGKGYMQEAVKAIISFSSSEGFIKLDGFTHPENSNSIHLLKKIGFEELGPAGSELRFCLKI